MAIGKNPGSTESLQFSLSVPGMVLADFPAPGETITISVNNIRYDGVVLEKNRISASDSVKRVVDFITRLALSKVSEAEIAKMASAHGINNVIPPELGNGFDREMSDFFTQLYAGTDWDAIPSAPNRSLTQEEYEDFLKGGRGGVAIGAPKRDLG